MAQLRGAYDVGREITVPQVEPAFLPKLRQRLHEVQVSKSLLDAPLKL